MDGEGTVTDTNVLIVANGRDTHPDSACQIACITAIMEIRSDGIAVLDSGGSILAEYVRHCSHSGQPGVGDGFFKYLFDNQYSGARVRLAPITSIDDPQRGFAELPKNTLDRSDRKFLAAAVVARAVIINATDSDWLQEQALVERLSVVVRQLCPQHAERTQPVGIDGTN